MYIGIGSEIDETEFRAEFEKVRKEIVSKVCELTKDKWEWDNGAYEIWVTQKDENYVASFTRYPNENDPEIPDEELIMSIESDSLSGVLANFRDQVEDSLHEHLLAVKPMEDKYDDDYPHE